MANRQNTCTNPSCTNNVTGWGGASTPTRQTGLTGFPVTTGARYSSGSFMQTQAGVASPGLAYTGSMYVRPNGANAGGGTLFLVFQRSSGGDDFGHTVSLGTLTNNVVTRISLANITAPANTTGIYLLVDGIGLNLGGAGNVDFTAVLLEQTAAVDTFFDGDTASASWDGAAGNSSSTLASGTTHTADSTASTTAALASTAVKTTEAASATATTTALTSTAVKSAEAAVSAQTTAALSSTAAKTAEAAASTATAMTLAASAVVTAEAAGTGSTTAALASAATVTRPATAALTTTAALTATAETSNDSSAALLTTTALTASATVVANATAPFATTAGLLTVGQVGGAIPLSNRPIVTVSGRLPLITTSGRRRG